MKSILIILLACILGSVSSCNTSMPKTSYTMEKGVVKKVFSNTDKGHKFIAYLVVHNGAEIIVSDMIGSSSYKMGDTIEFMDQKMEIDTDKIISYSVY